MSKIGASELIINSDGSIFHLHIKPEQLADNVILVGDPSRVQLVKSFFDSIESEHSNREFVSATGYYKSKRFTVLSTGIGTDNIDIVMNELDALANIDFVTKEIKQEKRSLSILRIGTSGALHPDIKLGSFVFSHISIGADGLLNWYRDRDKYSLLEFEKEFIKHTNWLEILPKPYFAKAHLEIINKFEDYTIKGMTVSASGFYGPQGRVLRLPLAMPDIIENFRTFEFNGYRLTNFEMEGSALAGLSNLLGHKAGTVCCIIANRYVKESITDYNPYINQLIRICLDRL